mmetsp:Transcript_6264/g.13761  ORF Transcript_6264/g.13761 Transcript_6264/m.13761 type:complete len:162 (+) Transcript_6264:126-611(+)
MQTSAASIALLFLLVLPAQSLRPGYESELHYKDAEETAGHAQIQAHNNLAEEMDVHVKKDAHSSQDEEAADVHAKMEADIELHEETDAHDSMAAHSNLTKPKCCQASAAGCTLPFCGFCQWTLMSGGACDRDNGCKRKKGIRAGTCCSTASYDSQTETWSC